jgi:hypothetical protein
MPASEDISLSFHDTRQKMQAALADDLRAYAGKRWPSGNAKFRKGRLADLLGFSERRVRSFWEAKAAAPRDHEIEAIKALIGAEKDEANAEAYRAMEARFAAMEAELAELRAAIAGAALAAESLAAGRSGRKPDRQGQGLHGRRSTD